MALEIYKEKTQEVVRIYSTLRFFVGENRIYRYGDILCVSTKNNDYFDLYLIADGVSTFVELYKKHEEGGGGDVPSEVIESIFHRLDVLESKVGPDTVGTDEIIDGAVHEQDLNDSVRDRMTITHDSSTGGLRIGGYAKPGEVPANDEES